MRLILAAATMCLVGCVTPPIYGLRFHTTPELPELDHVAILCVDRGSRDGYEQSFENKFGDRKTYLEHIAQQVSEAIQGSKEIVNLEEEHAEELNAATSRLPFDTSLMGEVFTQLDPKFTHVLVVTRWRISRDYSYHTHMTAGVNGQPGGMTNSQQSICKVELSGALFDREGTMLEAGRSQYGESVFLFAFGTALEKATTNASLKLAQLLTHQMPAENIENQEF